MASSMIEAEAPKRRIATTMILAALVGAVVFVKVYGIHILLPTHTDWIMRGYMDLRQHYLGWCLFRNAGWQFPFGLMDTATYPFNTSIIYTDSIPLLAVFFKILSPFLPEQFQYFGMWGIVCYMLQGALGALLCLKFTRSSLLAILGSVLFVLSSVMLEKMYHHSSLAAHWLILLSLALLLSRDTVSATQGRPVLYWGLIGGLCAGIHAYFLPMCGLICLGYITYDLLRRKFMKAIMPFLSFVVSAGIVNYLMGAFALPPDSLASGGLRELSFNLNGFVNPQGYSKYLSNLSNYVPEQNWEGIAYLGLGLIVLCLAALVCLFWKYLVKEDDDDAPEAAAHADGKAPLSWTTAVILCVLFFAFVALALSPTITLNENVVLDIPLPDTVEKLWSVFRSTGRFIWPAMYILTLLAFAAVATTASGTIAFVIVAGCVILQVSDFGDVIRNKNNTFNKESVAGGMSDTNPWKVAALDKELQHMVISGSIADSYARAHQAANIAQENKWTINFFYLARSGYPIYETWKNSLENPQDTMIFVFQQSDFDEVLAASRDFHYYDMENGFYAATLQPLSDSLRTANARELASQPFTYSYSFDQNRFFKEKGEDRDGVRLLYEGGKSFGPFLSLNAGVYEIVIQGAELDAADLSCVASGEYGGFPLRELRKSSSRISCKVLLDRSYDEVEIRINNTSFRTMTLSSITIRAVVSADIDFLYQYSFSENSGNKTNAEDIDGVRYLNEGGVSYGPYIGLNIGTYEVTITGSNLDQTRTDCISRYGEENIEMQNLRVSPSTIRYRINLSRPATNLETRVFNQSQETVAINSITIRAVRGRGRTQ